MIQVVTDNRNRAVADIRRWFNKLGGSLGEAGCVAWQFEPKGYFTLRARRPGPRTRSLTSPSRVAPTTWSLATT